MRGNNGSINAHCWSVRSLGYALRSILYFTRIPNYGTESNYVVYDPGHHLGDQDVYAFKLEDLDYVPMQEAWFPGLGLGLRLWEGVYQGVQATWLRWYSSDGQWLRT